MVDSIPFEVAKEVAETHGCRQVILLAWTDDRMHVVTYGGSADDSDLACEKGNHIKKAFGWPASVGVAESPKVAALRNRISELEGDLSRNQQLERARDFARFWHETYGWTHEYIADRLNFQNTSHPDGSPWTGDRVRSVLARDGGRPDA